jgi:hypothetical protein
VAGQFTSQPDGLILHGSRSGQHWTLGQEFDVTRRYCVNNPEGLSWQATIGEDRYSVHMDSRSWGWSAREHSYRYLALEFSQANLGDPISDAQVRAAVAWVKAEALKSWPLLNLTKPGALPTHAELPAGVRDGKTDAYELGDSRADDLRRRILAQLRAR